MGCTVAVSDNLTQLEDWAASLLLKIEPSGRRKIANAITIALRRSQQQRIGAQQNPDGTPFVPRKRQKNLRGKKGRIKRDMMFAKLRTASYLKAKATHECASIEITGYAGRIATVHQYGAVDRVSLRGPRVRYAQRKLLGFADVDRALVRDLLIEHLIH